MNKIEINSGLNPRQWKLYRYLKKNGDNWVYQEQIAKDLPDLYPAREQDFKDFHNSRCRQIIGTDIRAINESEVIYKPILSGSRGVKIASKKEIDKYLKSNISSVVRKLQRLKKLAQKVEKDGQYRLKLSEYQKEIVEAFID